MAHYILHVGYGKTGTTALQNFLAANRDILRARGVLYPDALVRGAWLRAKDHNMIARSMFGQVGWCNVTVEEYFDQFEKQRIDADVQTVILSGESFMGAIMPWDFSDAESYWLAMRKAVERLGNILKSHQVSIIVYLRRQDHWMDSAINQTIKFGGLLACDAAQKDAQSLIDMYGPRLDYARALDVWAKVFSDDAIKVGVYEAGQLHVGGIVDDFFALVGLDQTGLIAPPQDSSACNNRLSRDMLEIKRIFNRIERPKYKERVLVECLRSISSAMGEAEEEEWPLLDNVTRSSLVERSESSNVEVALRFLGRSDGILFMEAKPPAKNDGQEYPGLSVERALEIVMRVDHYLSSFIGRRQLARHWLAEVLRHHAPVLHGVARWLRAMQVKRS